MISNVRINYLVVTYVLMGMECIYDFVYRKNMTLVRVGLYLVTII